MARPSTEPKTFTLLDEDETIMVQVEVGEGFVRVKQKRGSPYIGKTENRILEFLIDMIVEVGNTNAHGRQHSLLTVNSRLARIEKANRSSMTRRWMG